MAGQEAAISDLLKQMLDEYGSRLGIDGGSSVLVSDTSLASTLYKATEPVRTPVGPKITVAKRGGEDEGNLKDMANANFDPADNLKWEHYSHAIFGIGAEDPKQILEGFKRMISAMQPKAPGIIIAPKQESGQKGEDNYTLSLEDKITYQSKGKVQNLSDMLEVAGFERSKIRAFDKSTDAGGKKTDAEVVLVRKWDQLSG